MEEEGGGSYEDDRDGEERSPGQAESSEDEDEGDDESLPSYSQTKIRYLPTVPTGTLFNWTLPTYV
jgi:hypothetical protein